MILGNLSPDSRVPAKACILLPFPPFPPFPFFPNIPYSRPCVSPLNLFNPKPYSSQDRDKPNLCLVTGQALAWLLILAIASPLESSQVALFIPIRERQALSSSYFDTTSMAAKSPLHTTHSAPRASGPPSLAAETVALQGTRLTWTWSGLNNIGRAPA